DGGSDTYEFSNHYYNRATELTSVAGELYSNWTDNFSTEIRTGYSEVINSQITLGPKDIGEIRIFTPGGARVFLGADDSRQANELSYDTTFFKCAGNYFIGDPVITGGFEREELSVFNMFVQHARGGEYEFNSIDDFENGLAARVWYGNAAGTHNPREAAGAFDYARSEHVSGLHSRESLVCRLLL